MNTDQLIAMLATTATPVEPNAAARRYAVAMGCSAFGAALLMVVLLGVRSDLSDAAMLPTFWVKVMFVAGLAAAGLVAAMRLSRPGVPLGWVPCAFLALVVGMWALAAIQLFNVDPALRPELFFGTTWQSCPFWIAMLSTPMFIAVLWAMKGLAPTRLRLAGAAMGFAAGAMGALVYSLHCPELAAPFLGFWYLLGMLIPTAVGMALGPRLLHW
jgi:hypothetical protein